MAEDESYHKGMAARRQVLGDAWVDRTLKNRNAFNTEFQEQITRHAGNCLSLDAGVCR